MKYTDKDFILFQIIQDSNTYNELKSLSINTRTKEDMFNYLIF